MVKRLLGLTAVLLSFTACFNYTGPSYDIHYDAIVLNQGTLSYKDASLSHIDEVNKVITNDIYEAANSNESINSVGQDILVSSYGSVYSLYASEGGNKIIMTHPLTHKKIATLTDGLDMPRNMAIKGEYLYVTNWGQMTNSEGWLYENSFITVYSIHDNRFLGKFEPDADHHMTNAEDIVCFDMFAFVTTREGLVKLDISNSYEPERIQIMNVIKPEGEYLEPDLKAIPSGYPKSLQKLTETTFAVSYENGIAVFDITKGKFVQFVEVEGMEFYGFITTNADGTYVYSYNTDFTNGSSQVYKTDIVAGTVEKVADGNNVTAIGVSPFTHNLYVANSPGYDISTIDVYNASGQKVTSYTAGICTYRFAFIGYQTEKED